MCKVCGHAHGWRHWSREKILAALRIEVIYRFASGTFFFLSLQDVCIGLHCRLCASVCSFASIISGFDRLIKLKRFASVTYLNGVK